MAKQETLISKKRGPAPTGRGHPILVRLHPDQLATVDAWIEHQPDELTRPEAVRRLIELGLKGQ